MRRTLERLNEIPGLRLYGIADPSRVDERTPTFCFNLDGWTPEALSTELGQTKSRSSRRSAAARSASRCDREGHILVCVAGMGLVRVSKEREVELLTDQTQRSLFTIQDDTTIRMADDLDVAPDGIDLFLRRDEALRHRELGPRSAGGAAERAPLELRSEDAQDPNGLRQSRVPERRLPDP